MKFNQKGFLEGLDSYLHFKITQNVLRAFKKDRFIFKSEIANFLGEVRHAKIIGLN